MALLIAMPALALSVLAMISLAALIGEAAKELTGSVGSSPLNTTPGDAADSWGSSRSRRWATVVTEAIAAFTQSG